MAKIEVIRKQLSPSTRTTVDECGVILGNDNTPVIVRTFVAAAPLRATHAPLTTCGGVWHLQDHEIGPLYWNAAGAFYAYVFANLTHQGIDVLGESQLTGFPNLPSLNLAPQFPSVSLLNWTTGVGNPRYWVLTPPHSLPLVQPRQCQLQTLAPAPGTAHAAGELCGW